MNNQQIIEEIKEEIKLHIETQENENTTIPKLWDSVKVVLGGRFIAIQAHLKKQEKNQINNLTLHLKQLEKRRNEETQGQQKKINHKNQAEINEKETKETTAKINKPKSWFFENTNKTDKPLARVIKKKRAKNQVNRTRKENGEITTDNTEIQRILRNYYQQLYDNKIDKLEEIVEFLEKYNLPKLNQKEIENLNRPITSMETKAVIRNLLTNKSPGPDDFTDESTKNLEKS